MPLTGVIPYGSGFSPMEPNGDILLIGQDGQHYVAANVDAVTLGHVESETTVFSRTTAQWRTDLASDDAGGGSPLAGLTGTYNPKQQFSITGTDTFIILGGGQYTAPGLNTRHVVGVIYEVVNSSTVNVVGGFLFNGTAAENNHLADGGVVGEIHGQLTIGSDVWIILTCGFIRTALCKLPISGSTSQPTAGSWDTRVFTLPWSWRFWHGSSTRRYYNRGTLQDAGSGVIRVLAYASPSEVPGNMATYSGLFPIPSTAFMVSTDVTPGVGNTGVNDVSSAFGIPFADETFNYAGDPGTARDCYTAPSSILGTTQLALTRVFSDEQQKALIRFYTMDSGGTVVVGSVEELDFDFPVGIVFGSPERAMVFKEGSEYHVGLWGWTHIAFATLGIVPDEESGEGEGVGCETEDEADQLSVAFEWPRCILIPTRINADVVSPTVSPGRAFSGFEQVVKPDAGHWRIIYHDIRVRTRAHVLQWRDLETSLNGRAEAISVPVYEGRLSDEDIIAASVDAYSIGETIIGISQSAGEDIRPGMHFSAGEWLYRIKSAEDTGLGYSNYVIWPPLREEIEDGENLDFNTPHCRCRLAQDDGMDVALELLRFGKPSVEFVEDV